MYTYLMNNFFKQNPLLRAHFAAWTLLFLWSSSLGLPIQQVWCHDRIVGQSLLTQPETCQGQACGFQELQETPCCKTEIQILQLSERNWQNNTPTPHSFAALTSTPPTLFLLYPHTSGTMAQRERPPSGPPPDRVILFESLLN